MIVPKDITQRLRKEFQQYCAPIEYNKTIKKILLVGAKIEDDQIINDEITLSWNLMKLKEFGIPVDQQFELEAVNIDPVYGGEDFLVGQYNADFILICWIFNGFDITNKYEGDYSRSPYHSFKDRWLTAAVNSGAKVLYVAGTKSTEINERHFEDGPFKMIFYRNPDSIFLHKDYDCKIREIIR
jgi:hypothetical protein